MTGRNALPSVSVSRRFDEYIVRCAITLFGDEKHMRGWKMKNIVTHNQGGWEPRVKGEHTFKGFHVLWGEGDVEGLKISVQLLDFPPTNDWEDIRRLLKRRSALCYGHTSIIATHMHDIRNRHCSDVFRADLFCYLLELPTDLDLIWCAFPT